MRAKMAQPGGRRAAAARPLAGFALLLAIVGAMWIVEVANSLDSGGLDRDGLYARNVDRLWGILTAPFIHASFSHLLGNTIPFLFLGAIIALRGAARLGLVTGAVIVLGGIGTWLISPAGAPTIGASGVVFGYATYLMTRGIFDRRPLELATGVIVGAVWGAVLLSSLVPRPGVSWQGHLCGGIAGVIVAAWLSRRRGRDGRARVGRPAGRPSPLAP